MGYYDYKKKERIREILNARWEISRTTPVTLEIERRFKFSQDQLDALCPFEKHFGNSLYYAGGFYGIEKIEFFEGFIVIVLSRTTYHTSDPPEILSSNEFYYVHQDECGQVFNEKKLTFPEGEVILRVGSGNWVSRDIWSVARSKTGSSFWAEDNRGDEKCIYPVW